jgi:hypothetical protein
MKGDGRYLRPEGAARDSRETAGAGSLRPFRPFRPFVDGHRPLTGPGDGFDINQGDVLAGLLPSVPLLQGSVVGRAPHGWAAQMMRP